MIVADVVAEWASRHGRPCALHLSGPAGGDWSSADFSSGDWSSADLSRDASGRVDRPVIVMDAVEFCRAVSGRGPADGLLTTFVAF